MFLAFATASRSGELGRQVGAVLTDDLGDVLALGSNDVPRRQGGSYWPTPDDQRDIVKKRDANTKNRDKLMRVVAEELNAEEAEVLAIQLADTSLKEITEFGRAVHAEMDALLACARTGRSTRGTTMYVTTFPCHNCARHIVVSGVTRVVFIEPYPKSRALELHDDDIVEVLPGSPEDEEGRVRLEPFVGIGPRRFFDYFSMNLGSGYLVERKTKSGDLADWDPSTIGPRTQAPEEGYLKTEAQLARELRNFLK
jgi:deoxycytidylate deaminase